MIELMESKPLNEKKQRNTAIVKEMIWLLLKEEVNRPIEVNADVSKTKPI